MKLLLTLLADRIKAWLRPVIIADYRYYPRVRNWNQMIGGNLYRNLIAQRDMVYEAHLMELGALSNSLAGIGYERPASGLEPYWSNPAIPPLDAISLYGFLALKKPSIYLEVGSGQSTRFARRAIRDLGLSTRLISIDPCPRDQVDSLCDEVIRRPLEEVSDDFFSRLGPGDLFFLDCSHRSFQNSDVTTFFTSILPRLQTGVFWGLHDIFIPYDYPEQWTGRYYNEQYLLMTYLQAGAAGDLVEFPACYLCYDKKELLHRYLHPFAGQAPWRDLALHGAIFWMSKS